MIGNFLHSPIRQNYTVRTSGWFSIARLFVTITIPRIGIFDSVTKFVDRGPHNVIAMMSTSVAFKKNWDLFPNMNIIWRKYGAGTTMPHYKSTAWARAYWQYKLKYFMRDCVTRPDPFEHVHGLYLLLHTSFVARTALTDAHPIRVTNVSRFLTCIH